MGTVKRTFANNLLTSGKIDATDGLSGTIPATNLADASLTNVTSFPSSLGGAVSSVASDPPSPSDGQIWFNSTSKVLKQYAYSASWATGGNMNTAKYGLTGTGTQTAGLAFAGTTTPNVSPTTSEEYNGSTWTNSGSISTAKTNVGSAGIQTAALGFGGYVGGPTVNTNVTESYDGSTWTTVNSLNTTRRSLTGCGIQTAALGFAGQTPAFTGATEEYDGSTWATSPGSLATARSQLVGAGTQTAALGFGGTTPPHTGATEEYDGTSWTSGGALNTARSQGAGSINGTQTAALGFGGNTATGVTNTTELYDGTSWGADVNLATPIRSHGGAGTSTSALGFGGYSPAGGGDRSATEEYTAGLGTQTITVS